MAADSRPQGKRRPAPAYLPEPGEILPAALGLASAGWPVLPLLGKVPHTAHGFHDSTTDPDQVRQWWQRWPRANVGIALPLGVVVIDVDPRHGGDQGVADLVARYGDLPQTLTAVSGRGDGGRHLFLQHPRGRLTQRAMPEGVDLREGGRHYVVAAPSVHPETGGRYWWANTAPVAPCPAWLAGLLRPAPAPSRPAVQPQGQPRGGDGLVRYVQRLQPGNRNHGLYWAVCEAIRCGRLDQIEDDLYAAAQAIGLPDHEIRTVVRSARDSEGGRRR